MPRPGDKPPTEGGKITELNKEFLEFAGEASSLQEQFAKFYTFATKKFARAEVEIYELNRKIEELSKK